MKIAILTLGTRGDVQPFAVLGRALKERGHEVTMATAKNFEALVLSYGINFIPVEVDFQAVLDSEEGKKMMKGNLFAIRRNLKTWIYPLISDSLGAFYELAKTNDKVIYHVKTLADAFADQFPNKMIRASVLPVVEPTTKFANPAFSGLPIPGFLNKLTYKLANKSIKLLSKPIGEFREKYQLPLKYSIGEVRNIYGISEHFLPMPKDYASTSIFTGFWYDHSANDLPPALIDFIKEGSPPLLITFGSMPFQSKFDLYKATIELTEKLNIRIIVIKGWGLGHTDKLDNLRSIKVIDSAPYDKLFPLIKAVVHHGGIGTTAECLRAGKPFFVCPILYPLGDQEFWGQLAFRRGLAVKPISLKKMTQKFFFEQVEELLSDSKLYANATRLSESLKQEEGLQTAVAEIEKR